MQHPEACTVHEKLEFHPEHKLGNWVEQQAEQNREVKRALERLAAEKEKS